VRRYRKITKREVREHAKFLASLNNHEEFLMVLGLQKRPDPDLHGQASVIWELRNTPRNKGFYDTWCRSRIGRQLDELKARYNVDVLGLRRLVLRGETIQIHATMWNRISAILTKYPSRHWQFVLGGIRITSSASDREWVELSAPAAKRK
jgi:hypothetical protein